MSRKDDQMSGDSGGGGNLRDNTSLVEQEPPVVKDEVLPEGILARIPLRRPLKDQDDKMHTVLEIREPTATDYINHGDPYRMIDNAIESNPRVGLAYLEACTGIHGAILKAPNEGLHVYDMMKAVGELANFFGEA